MEADTAADLLVDSASTAICWYYCISTIVLSQIDTGIWYINLINLEELQVTQPTPD